MRLMLLTPLARDVQTLVSFVGLFLELSLFHYLKLKIRHRADEARCGVL